MDSVKRSAVTPSKSRLARTFAKVLHIRVATGLAPVDGNRKVKSQKKLKDDLFRDDGNKGKPQNQSLSFEIEEDDLHNKEALEAHLAKIFASISSVKAAYAQLQYAQHPYDADGIHAADRLIVSELKNLSELKQCYVKKQFDMSPERTLLSAEIQEQKALLKTYEVMGKKMEYQQKLKDSEISSLKEKLEELNKQNKLCEKRLNQSGPLSILDNLHLSGLSSNNVIVVLRHAIKSIRSFVRLMIDEMKSADWDINAAASAIEPGIVYWKADHKCFAFESFVCREMFDAFQYPNFSISNESLPERSKWKHVFFNRFVELKSTKPKDYLAQKPRSTFGKFCRVKYLQLIHPKMESAFFGNLNQRNIMNSGGFPDTTFFALFAEMAKRVWLLHCLAFSFEPEAEIFQVSKGCRFSEVYMETIAEETTDSSLEYDPRVAFTVVPGFRIGKDVIQCQVYLLNSKSR